MGLLASLRLLLKGPTPKEMAAQLRRPHGFMARKVGERMNAANRFLYTNTWPALELRDGMRVLEIGFGNGQFLGELARQANNLELHGLDLSAAMVQEASTHHASLIGTGALSLVNGASDRMPYAEAFFDRIFCINVVYFRDDPSAHLRELHRVLKPDGTFTAVLRARSSMERLPFASFGFTMYEQADWERVLRANGFRPLRTVVLKEPEAEYEGRKYSPRSLVMVAARR